MKIRVEEIVSSFLISIYYISTYLPHSPFPDNLTSCSSRRNYFFDLKPKQILLLLECHNGFFHFCLLFASKLKESDIDVSHCRNKIFDMIWRAFPLLLKLFCAQKSILTAQILLLQIDFY